MAFIKKLPCFRINKIISYNFCNIIEERIYLKDKNVIKSFWHDVNLRDNGLYNMVIEIPAFSKIRFEMSTIEDYNPIKIKHSKKIPVNTEYPVRIRNYDEDPVCNYGFFPQTYSSKEKKYRNNFVGDGDPLDVIEIGGPFNKNPGDIIQVKLIGSFCLIDQGEVDWKIVVANTKEIVSKDKYPEIINHTMHWFKIFKTFFGKKENIILDDNKFFSMEETIEIIEECHKDYFNLQQIKQKV